MPTQKTVIEYDYDEFERLCVERLGLERDFSIVASEEWGNYQDHQFSIDPKDLEGDSLDRESVDEFYRAVLKYKKAVAANGGIDPYVGYSHGRVDNEAIREARKTLHSATYLHVLALALYEQGALAAGDYVISVFW